MANSGTTPSSGLYYRHRLPVRIMHWINLLALTILLMSGLQIFNAHPALYWGDSSYSGAPAIFEIVGMEGSDGNLVGVTEIFGHKFTTTGVLGVSRSNGSLSERAFPSWATIPGPQWLAMARRWHLFFAWVLVLNGTAYVVYSVVSRHLARDLAPTRTDWRSFGRSIRDHLTFTHPTGEAAKHYNVLQKITYLAVIFGLLPLVILCGWAMSPRLDTVIPAWVNILGGRQSARTIHFIGAWLLVAFVLVHVFEVLVSGVWNNLRSMVTGRYRVPPAIKDETAP
jgi:thiosulfate reductase cytochrome b subunit